MGNYISIFNYKKFALALLGAATAQLTAEDTAYACASHEDCDKNFDAIYAEWENSAQAAEPSTEPKKGDMKCAKGVTLSGTDEETGEAASINGDLCTQSAACMGFEWADEEGNGIKIPEGACSEGNAKALTVSMA